MEQFDGRIIERIQKETIEIPKDVHDAIENTLDSLHGRKRKMFPYKPVAAAAILALVLILPNANSSISYAMQQIPVLGDFFKVITVREYKYDDSYHDAKVEIPKITLGDDTSQEAVDYVNASVEELTERLIQQFESEVAFVEDRGHSSMEISYEVITNSDTWFTLRLQVYEGAGSSNTYFEFYHIDKASGQICTLSDLFVSSFDYQSVFSEEIRKQMKERMENNKDEYYWLDSEYPEMNFNKIDKDQNFYFTETGDITIVFDKYEVAPGYMGAETFIINRSLFEEYLKDCYK